MVCGYFASWGVLRFKWGQSQCGGLFCPVQSNSEKLHKFFKKLWCVVLVGVLSKKSDVVKLAFVSSKALCRFGKILR
jgi:hypothetical protein